MKSLDLKSFYAQSLGISSPWKVTDVIFDGEHRVVTVFVECASGVAWADPETGERAEIKDWQERTWRHLDTCQFQTIVTARVPRLLLKNGKSITASLPWAQRDRLPEAARRVSTANHKAVRKGYCYASLLINLNGGGVIDTVEGRTTEAATGLLEVLPPSSRTGVKAVAMDMSSAYVSAAQAVL